MQPGLTEHWKLGSAHSLARWATKMPQAALMQEDGDPSPRRYHNGEDDEGEQLDIVHGFSFPRMRLAAICKAMEAPSQIAAPIARVSKSISLPGCEP